MSLIEQIITENEIKNFTIGEILHNNIESNIPEELFPNIAPTLKLLQLIRDDIQTPIIIHSTYRSEKHNKEVGGEENSLHLSFNAIDFSPVGYDSEKIQALYQRILSRSFVFIYTFKGVQYTVTPNLCGIGLYSTFLHIDTRGLLGRPPATWRG